MRETTTRQSRRRLRVKIALEQRASEACLRPEFAGRDRKPPSNEWDVRNVAGQALEPPPGSPTPQTGSGGRSRRVAYPAIALIRADMRDRRRATVLRWIRPRLAPRISSGCAARNADRASAWSPLAIASSTLRRKVLIRLMRIRLTSVRRSICRILFFAEAWCAISSNKSCRRGC